MTYAHAKVAHAMRGFDDTVTFVEACFLNPLLKTFAVCQDLFVTASPYYMHMFHRQADKQ